MLRAHPTKLTVKIAVSSTKKLYLIHKTQLKCKRNKPLQSEKTSNYITNLTIALRMGTIEMPAVDRAPKIFLTVSLS
jgi:hypothetical protein